MCFFLTVTCHNDFFEKACDGCPFFLSEDLFVFLDPQVMVPCRPLPTTTTTTHHHLVHLVTLRSGALGDPTAGHLATERLPLLLQDPQQQQSLQLPLATAGTHGVPKDEIRSYGGSCGKTMDVPISPCPLFKKQNKKTNNVSNFPITACIGFQNNECN